MAGLLLVAATALAQTRPAPVRTQIADGIYLYRTAPYGEVGLDGNSIAIISSDGVLVFDTNGTPSAAAAVLADIKTLTTQPVRYVVNSHWHWDHWYGTEVYTRAFPDVNSSNGATSLSGFSIFGTSLKTPRAENASFEIGPYVYALGGNVGDIERAAVGEDSMAGFQALAGVTFSLGYPGVAIVGNHVYAVGGLSIQEATLQ